jgi:tetratricopeptide (TPR) repeat protein
VEVVSVMAGLSVLRLVDRPASGGGRSVTVEWLTAGFGPRSVTVPVTVVIDDGLTELVRWYLEEYAEFPSDPAPAVAVRAEAALEDLGGRLFAAVFDSGAAAGMWGQALAAGLDRVRVEIDTDPADVPGLPWELLREPGSGRALVLGAAEFVRTHRQAAGPVLLPEPGAVGLRVLLVICRPGGRDDVPFRSVASRLVRGGVDRLPWLHLDVLRPATFARLGEVLRAAAEAGEPYHVVHFDGHGTYLDTTELTDVPVSSRQYGLAGPSRAGRHGYLLFEDPQATTNQQLVDGPALARLLVRHRVPVLVLNACRSAFAEPQAAPEADAGSGQDRIRAYGSLAAEIADAGVAGVVAMRYNVYVVTAAQFVADLYTQLGAGHSLGRAATTARQRLADDPTRHIGDSPIALQDWVVPTIYESEPLTLLDAGIGTTPTDRIRIDQTGHATAGSAMPGGPEVGFFGRDETLLALDRAFDTSQLVLLHALAGAGKTTTVAEFARWYATTGGAGPVLWTSFEHHTPLDRVLDTTGTAFADLLEASGIHWSAVTDPAFRRQLVLTVLAQVPVLWIWDNIEPVAGFPDGTASAWTETEQQELRGFLHALKTQTKAKVLLTSRRDEGRWLGLLPTRLRLPAMPMNERLQLARGIAAQLDPQTALSGVDWRPLLRFTRGNPLTITVTVRQALREHATTSEQALTGFLERVSAGHAALEHAEDTALGRSGSLAASLDYGFTNAFTEPERAVLAVLHQFRSTVDVDVLRLMSEPRSTGADAVPALAGLDRETGIALLDRATDIGLLTSFGAGYYGIHPALPWYFHTLHTHYYGPDDAATANAVALAYAHAIAALGTYYSAQFEAGNTNLLTTLRVEESNLLHAIDLACHHQLPDLEIRALMGLNQLYHATGRNTEWARLVEQVLPDFLTRDGKPQPGQDDIFTVVTGWRVRIALNRRDLTTATELQTKLTVWDRELAQPYLDIPATDLDEDARHLIRSLAVSEQDLGRLQSEQGDPAAALPHFQACFDLMERLDDAGQAKAASSLGTVYHRLGDLDQSQHWHERSLELRSADNRIGRAISHGSLANVAYQRFQAAKAAGAPDAELLVHLNAARTGHQDVLDLLPPDHHQHRATAHNQLGIIYRVAGDVRTALRHYQQSIHHEEAQGNTYGAAQSRYNIAVLLATERPSDALHYAEAAYATYLALGPDTAIDARQTADLIQQLQRATPPQE